MSCEVKEHVNVHAATWAWVDVTGLFYVIQSDIQIYIIILQSTKLQIWDRLMKCAWARKNVPQQPAMCETPDTKARMTCDLL